jgi:hypothetical protein
MSSYKAGLMHIQHESVIAHVGVTHAVPVSAAPYVCALLLLLDDRLAISLVSCSSMPAYAALDC